MLNKETLIKIAVALLVIAIVYFIAKSQKKRKLKKPRKVIVTAMPTVERYDDMESENEMETYEDSSDDDEEGYASWNANDEQQEDYEDMSPVEFKSELLD